MEYVPGVVAALAELYRALRPGGRVLIWDIDWSTVTWHSGDPARMARVLRAWDEHLVHPSLPRTLAAQLRSVGFDDVHMTAHTFATTRLDPDSFAATVCQFVTHFVAGRCGLTEADVAAWMAEQRQLDERDEFFFASKAGRPLADLVPHQATPVVFGGLAGELSYNHDSFTSIDADIQRLFYGDDVTALGLGRDFIIDASL